MRRNYGHYRMCSPMNNNELQHTYSNNITYKRVLIIGPCPPPLGGVSVHVKRVMQKLTTQNNTVYYINPEKLYPYNFLRLVPFNYCAQLWYLIKLSAVIIYYRPEVIMYHSFCLRNSIPELALLIKLKNIFSYTCTFIEHDCRHMYQRSVKWKCWFNYYLTKLDLLICIGNTTHQSYHETGISMSLPTIIESAFLPPSLGEEKIICATYPKELFDFIAKHNPIIVINAFQLTLWQSNDLYGIDQSIEMLNNFKKTYPKIGLVVVLGSIGDQQYYHVLMQRVQIYALQDAIFIMHGQKELWPLLKYATLFVRPTLSDSYGISIAEALYVGTPAVASDVCKRPVGTMLYRVGDVNDLIEKVKATLRQAQGERNEKIDTDLKPVRAELVEVQTDHSSNF